MKIDGLIVVEGKSDVAFLSSFIDAEFVITNGSEISKDTISYIKKVAETKPVYVLTDPDYPGERIRKILDENVKNLNHCFIKKENSIKHGKVGVAESTKEEIESALKNVVNTSDKQIGSLTTNDLLELGLVGNDNSSKKRDQICEALHLGHCTAKTFLKRLNYCDIKIDDLKKIL